MPGGSTPLGGFAPLGGRRFLQIRNVLIFPTATSTNDLAKVLIEKVTSEDEEIFPTALLTRRQTAGRGRSGRSWTSPGDTGLALSLIVPWPEGPGRIRLPLAAGIAMARGLSDRFGLAVRLKWPNDLLVSRRKLGGILVEARASSDGEAYAVIGVGLNLTTTRESFDAAGLPEATSLALEGVRPELLSDDEPTVALLEILDGLLSAPPDDLSAAFEAVSAHRPGDALTVREESRTIEGRYLGVTRDGLLRLETPSGTQMLVAGDVTVF